MSATTGFMKCLIAEQDDRILGFAMLGERAGEVMTIVQTAMLADLPFTTLRDAIIAHPTMAEGLNILFAAIEPADRSRTLPVAAGKRRRSAPRRVSGRPQAGAVSSVSSDAAAGAASFRKASRSALTRSGSVIAMPWLPPG